MWRRVARVLACLMLLVVAPLPLVAQSRDWLGKGNVSVKTRDIKGYDSPEIIVKAVIDAPPAKVWKIVSDCARYKQTMNRIASSRQISQSGQEYVCEVEIEMPFPLSNIKGITKAVHKISETRWERSWSLVKGDYKYNNGSWVLEPFDESGQRTLATYRVHAEPNTSVPDWIREKAQKKSLPELIERVRKESKKLK